MKQFAVDIDITMSKRIYIDAENEDEAREKVEQKMEENPYEQARDFTAFMDYDITDVNEEDPEEERTALDDALDYVREQLDADELMIIKSRVSYNLDHRLPAASEVNDGRIIDLLEEYGADNDLPEGWWEECGDIEDVLMKL